MEQLRDRFTQTQSPSRRERMSIEEFEASVRRHGEAQARLQNLVTVESEKRRELQELSVCRLIGGVK